MPTFRSRTSGEQVGAIQWLGSSNCRDVFALVDMEHEDAECCEVHLRNAGAPAYLREWIVRWPDGSWRAYVAYEFEAEFDPIPADEHTTPTP